MLALFAGTGGLPPALLGRLAMRPLVCALDGHPPDGVAPDIVFRIETLGTLLADLRARRDRGLFRRGGVAPRDRPRGHRRGDGCRWCRFCNGRCGGRRRRAARGDRGFRGGRACGARRA
jgi:hypothetical protein